MKVQLLVLLLVFSSSVVISEDLGRVGKVYKIKEKSLIDVIKEKVQERIENGEVDTLNNELKEKSLATAKRPRGVYLPRAKHYRLLQVIPEYTLDKDIFDGQGNLIFKKGITVNPLTIRPLSKTLCFVNADDIEQVEWLSEFCAKNPLNKIIITNGDYGEVAKKIGRRVYFDQGGYLISRLGIQALPAIVRQGRRGDDVLYIEEFTVETN